MCKFHHHPLSPFPHCVEKGGARLAAGETTCLARSAKHTHEFSYHLPNDHYQSQYRTDVFFKIVKSRRVGKNLEMPDDMYVVPTKTAIMGVKF